MTDGNGIETKATNDLLSELVDIFKGLMPQPKPEPKTEAWLCGAVVACATVLCAIGILDGNQWMIVAGAIGSIYTAGRTGVKIAEAKNGNGNGA
jgi:hypothetical protein